MGASTFSLHLVRCQHEPDESWPWASTRFKQAGDLSMPQSAYVASIERELCKLVVYVGELCLRPVRFPQPFPPPMHACRQTRKSYRCLQAQSRS